MLLGEAWKSLAVEDRELYSGKAKVLDHFQFVITIYYTSVIVIVIDIVIVIESLTIIYVPT